MKHFIQFVIRILNASLTSSEGIKENDLIYAFLRINLRANLACNRVKRMPLKFSSANFHKYAHKNRARGRCAVLLFQSWIRFRRVYDLIMLNNKVHLTSYGEIRLLDLVWWIRPPPPTQKSIQKREIKEALHLLQKRKEKKSSSIPFPEVKVESRIFLF